VPVQPAIKICRAGGSGSLKRKGITSKQNICLKSAMAITCTQIADVWILALP
jgi:hypothetical protein